jgi:hypothetical protein
MHILAEASSPFGVPFEILNLCFEGCADVAG